MVFTKVEDALSNCEVSAFGGRHAAEAIYSFFATVYNSVTHRI